MEMYSTPWKPETTKSGNDMRSDEELLKEIESQDFDPNAGKTYTKRRRTAHRSSPRAAISPKASKWSSGSSQKIWDNLGNNRGHTEDEQTRCPTKIRNGKGRKAVIDLDNGYYATTMAKEELDNGHTMQIFLAVNAKLEEARITAIARDEDDEISDYYKSLILTICRSLMVCLIDARSNRSFAWRSTRL